MLTLGAGRDRGVGVVVLVGDLLETRGVTTRLGKSMEKQKNKVEEWSSEPTTASTV